MATLVGDLGDAVSNFVVGGFATIRDGVQNVDVAYRWNRLGYQLSKYDKYRKKAAEFIDNFPPKQQYWPAKLAITVVLCASLFIYNYPTLDAYILRPIRWLLSPITNLFLRLVCSGYCEQDTGTSTFLIAVLLVYSVAATIYIYHLHHPQRKEDHEHTE